MAAHAQFCRNGDCTLEATRCAIQDVVGAPADGYFVFVVSDADLARYGIKPDEWISHFLLNNSGKLSGNATT